MGLLVAASFVFLKLLGLVVVGGGVALLCVKVGNLVSSASWVAFLSYLPLVASPAATGFLADALLTPADLAVIDLVVLKGSLSLRWGDLCADPMPYTALSVAALLLRLRKLHLLPALCFQEALLPLASHSSSDVRLSALTLLAS